MHFKICAVRPNDFGSSLLQIELIFLAVTVLPPPDCPACRIRALFFVNCSSITCHHSKPVLNWTLSPTVSEMTANLDWAWYSNFFQSPEYDGKSSNWNCPPKRKMSLGRSIYPLQAASRLGIWHKAVNRLAASWACFSFNAFLAKAGWPFFLNKN